MDFEGLEELSAYEGKQFVTSLDGPVTQNDNPREICSHFIERGERIFAVLSRYDQILTYALRRQGYKPGDHLRLVLPFIKAYGVSDNRLLEYSRKHISVMPGADKAMRFVQELMASFVVSSSYEHFVSAVCEEIGFPFDNAYCTRVSMDSVRIDDWESQILKNFAQEIAIMPLPELPPGARSMRELTPRDQQTIARLDEIFWHEMSDLSAYRLLNDVSIIGGDDKAASIVDVCKKTGVGTEDTMYIGGDLDDAQALALVKRGGGLPIAFNANEPALREAEVLVLSENSVTTSILAEAFHRAGREGAMSLVDNWNVASIRRSGLVHDYLVREMERVFPKGLPRVARITHDNVGPLVKESLVFRKSVKGETIHGLA
jgi:energy-converting hydrogenase A subunit R